MNPILPIQHFVPDAEARQFSDGRMYIYGSLDISGRTSYCSWEYHVFSSADLIHWEDHGESFRSTGPDSDVPWSGAPLYAPDCVYHNGRYYLFFCNADRSEGVAESLSPAGRFTNAAPVEGADGDAIDPAALVDDDGQVYYYWGQFNLRGAKLRPDMRGIQPETLNTNVINEAEHGFHEGASIRKRNGIYYLVYTDISRGRATCMAYATSRSPLGRSQRAGSSSIIPAATARAGTTTVRSQSSRFAAGQRLLQESMKSREPTETGTSSTTARRRPAASTAGCASSRSISTRMAASTRWR